MSILDPKEEERNVERYPLIPLRDMVVFPYTLIPFIVGRKSSIDAIRASLAKDKKIFLVMQKDAETKEPTPEQMHKVGTLANIIHSFKLPEGNYKLLVEGICRGQIIGNDEEGGTQHCTIRRVEIKEEISPRSEELMRRTISLFEEYLKNNQNLPFESMVSSIKVSELGKFTDTVVGHIQISSIVKQDLLDTFIPSERLEKIEQLLINEINKLQVDKQIHSRVKKQMERAQKEYYLNEKMKAIQKELGRRGEKGDEIEEFQKKIREAKLPKDALEKADQELKRLEAMPPISAESTVSRNYLEWLVSIPWHRKSREIRDIQKAEKILDEDHYGLEKIKERILEFLAVRQLVKVQRGSILCFVGPPGVGKTSLAKSIARATGRRFVRLSLGGVRDEAEIRGHRRTYIGAYPGRIIQMMRKAETINPVFCLDEVDKMSVDFRGDPSSALLEVLDPEQNNAFLDHYIDTEFDLSKVMFIATANVLHTVPDALRDRMEVMRLAGYTLTEKIHIAEQFLIIKQLKAHGLKEKNTVFERDALQRIIEEYTREAGVRNLEREIASICRKIARKVVKEGKDQKITVSYGDIPDYLGVPKFRADQAGEGNEIGLATGLAWTEMGGQIMKTEATTMKGKGNLILTGKLGDVMQESAQAALSYIRTRTSRLGIDDNFHSKVDIHIHVPEGSIPKDGPSGGITMATALTSSLTGVPVRHDVAMTGEITVLGKVLPIGGVKEKLLAAYRVAIKNIVLPRENEKDLADIPPDIKEFFKIYLVDHMDEVLQIALKQTGGDKTDKNDGKGERGTVRRVPDDPVMQLKNLSASSKSLLPH